MIEAGEVGPGRNQMPRLVSTTGPDPQADVAAGRLEDMSLGVECLLTDDPEQALAIAREIGDRRGEGDARGLRVEARRREEDGRPARAAVR